MQRRANRNSSAKGFSDTIRLWVNDTIELTDAVLREAVGLLVGELVKAMPYETGNLSRSVKITLDGIVPMDRDPKAQYVDPSAENAATLLNARTGDTIYISVTAPYAAAVNYGRTSSADGRSFNQTGAFYLIIAANKWPVVLRQALANVKARQVA